MLGEIRYTKIVPRNYGSIQHLEGSKMIDNRDKLLPIRESGWLLDQRYSNSDLVIITEKVDGSNVGVVKLGGKLYPVSRSGYDVRTSPHKFLQSFAYYVEGRVKEFDVLLSEGERLAGEWMYKTHTLRYNMKCDPFIVFDWFNADNTRKKFMETYLKVGETRLEVIQPVHIGVPVQIRESLVLLGKGSYGVQDDIPEGVVYRYEGREGFKFSAKYVSNSLVGNQELFETNISDESLLNKFRKMR